MSDLNSNLPKSFGALLKILFTPPIPNCLARTAFHKFMETYDPAPSQMLGKGSQTVAFDRFSIRLSNITKKEGSYAASAELLLPLAKFYSHIAKPETLVAPGGASVEDSHRKVARRRADFLEECVRSRLPSEVLERRGVWIPLTRDLIYVQDPIHTPKENAVRWRRRCMNGDASLFAESSAVFQAVHLRRLSLNSPLPILELARHLARACITYANYSLARKICARLLDGIASHLENGALKRDRIGLILDISRTQADALAYGITIPTRDLLAKPFDEAEKLLLRIQMLHPTFGSVAYLAHERDLLHVRIRAYARAMLLHPLFSKDHSDPALREDDIALIERLEQLINSIDNDPSVESHLRSRYVHWDSLCRGRALLLPEPIELGRADGIFSSTSGQEFSSDSLDTVPAEASEELSGDLHRRYRQLVTSIILAIRRAELKMFSNPEENLDVANEKLAEATGLVTEHSLLHGQVELALLAAKILSFQSKIEPKQ